MVPELPIMQELDCALKIQALRESGLKDPQRLLDLTISLVRQVYTLEHTTLTALARIGELQLEIALAATNKKQNAISQVHYEMANQILNDLGVDMP